MKKILGLVFLLSIVFSLFGVYNVGDIVDNFAWTDNTGADHDIHELTAAGNVIVLFWGGYG